jgi:hypothetical protein
MTISRLTAANVAASVPRMAHAPDAEEPVPGRTLVSLDRSAWRQVSAPIRPDASFVTHLIATAMQVPQTRTLRRVSPSDARNAYMQPPTHTRTGHGKIVSQKI